ncbi:hypothetical protein GCM10012290_15100 [Halolactibacillus alkaliphilus]|uniref:HTH tetR-type domain-containing protein n=1 Tax=Halolactibacillus alkaliphilus TaxID=442899 RepID=A0A511X1F9_9BACI|nr:TetR/AcrR family transcriptional regulator [Halolactibacillus alkaliphilus]GEN56750.1 hypothetical protein HAL01_12140 [Halolactibacillus alkaliphilus]GGN70844.1 hypothetical protein GCM10012290_15100 [Halolactibacillus alkaliphilus]SFO79901.1 transcriptional regulator, TetR family [Halolactibacillus alkaliphilus]
MTTDRKALQRKRMWQYFIDAAVDIIERDGLEAVTIRRVADLAGYTSSTAYNYFDDLSHVKFFASLKFTKPYIDDIPNYIDPKEPTIKQWLALWDCFLKHSFHSPHIFHMVFVSDLGHTAEDMFNKYYTMYPEELLVVPEELQGLLKEDSFSERSATFLAAAVQEGYIAANDVKPLAEVTHMIWVGALVHFINHRRSWSEEKAIKFVYEHVSHVIKRYVKEDKRHEL